VVHYGTLGYMASFDRIIEKARERKGEGSVKNQDYLLMALDLVKNNQYEKAQSTIEQGIKKDLDNKEAYFLLASIQLLMADYGAAGKNFIKAKKIDSSYPNIDYFLGLAFFHSEEPVQSEKYLTQALGHSTRKNSRQIKKYLGLLYAKYMSHFHYSILYLAEGYLGLNQDVSDESEKDLIKKMLFRTKIFLRNYRDKDVLVFQNRDELLRFMPAQCVVAELGVQEGLYSQKIWDMTHPKTLHLIDCWSHQGPEIYINDDSNLPETHQDRFHNKVRGMFKEQLKCQQVFIHREYTDKAMPTFSDQYFDWVYIDANHGYEMVLQDIQLSFKKIRPGGFIVLHDYISEELVPHYGVMKAVHELVKSLPLGIIAVTHEDFPTVVLKRF